MGGGAILNVRYKTMLQTERAEHFCVCTCTCDILGVHQSRTMQKKYTIFCILHSLYFILAIYIVAALLSGNALILINVVALRRARLVLGWVTVRGYTILVFNQSHPGLLSLAIPPWVGAMSTGDGLGHR